MSLISKTISIRVPVHIIYHALKDSRLEKLFPEYFIGVKRKIAVDKENKELTFETITEASPVQIIEKFRLIISGDNCTDVKYDTVTNVEENDVVLQSIVQTHIANILYSLLMLETGYINGLMKKRE